MKLDYSIQSPEERNKLVEKILEENPNPSPQYLEVLADYLVLCMEKEERKQRKLLTENRLATVNKRETSLEGLIAQMESGEDGIYGLINEDKNTIFQPKVKITKKDLEEIPDLRDKRTAIAYWEGKMKTAQGRDAYVIKRTIIDLRKDQYVIKNDFRKPMVPNALTRSKSPMNLDSTVRIGEEGKPEYEGASLLNPKVCSAILCDYSRLKEESWGQFDKDLWYIMEDFDRLSTTALEDYPLYERIVEYKIDGVQNIEIQKRIEEEFGIKHSTEYISSLWRNKIPKLIASAAEDEFLNEYYLNVEKGKYKKCSRCGQIKLANNKYFSKNKTSKDGFYSICKVCRNQKVKPKEITK